MGRLTNFTWNLLTRMRGRPGMPSIQVHGEYRDDYVSLPLWAGDVDAPYRFSLNIRNGNGVDKGTWTLLLQFPSPLSSLVDVQGLLMIVTKSSVEVHSQTRSDTIHIPV